MPVITSTVRAAFLPLAVLMAAALTAHAQDEPSGKFTNWTKVDGSDQRRVYVDAMREANPNAFAGPVRDFAVDTVLPQLQEEMNRSSIEVVRRKMRALLLDNVGDPKSFEAASRAVLDFMMPLARDEKADPVVRINAVLLIGELRARDNKTSPWAGSLEPLTSLAGDAKLPLAIRIAAMAGLAGHVEAAQKKGTATAASLGKALVPVFLPMIDGPIAGDRTAGDWLTSRALDMLPVVMPELGAEAAAAPNKVLADQTRPTDVRVRAAAALGTAARAASGIDAGQAISAIRALAIAAIEADLRTAEQRAGIGPAAAAPVAAVGVNPADGPAPAKSQSLSESVVRRAAWRLAVLARAIGAEEGKGGLVELVPENQKVAARDLAAALLQGSQDLDLAPVEETMRSVLDSLRSPAAEEQPAAAAQGKAAADPFGK